MMLTLPSVKLKSLLADVFGISSDEVTMSLAAGSIEAWDSIGHLEMILAVEQEFGVQFAPERIAELTTVGRLYGALEASGVVF
jgi:acyl carrier protein